MTKFAEHILILIHFGDPNDAVLDSTSHDRLTHPIVVGGASPLENRG